MNLPTDRDPIEEALRQSTHYSAAGFHAALEALAVLRGRLEQAETQTLRERDAGKTFRVLHEQAEASVVSLREALRAFSNPQHWAIRRDAGEPSFVWIGTYHETPIQVAAAALASSEGDSDAA